MALRVLLSSTLQISILSQSFALLLQVTKMSISILSMEHAPSSPVTMNFITFLGLPLLKIDPEDTTLPYIYFAETWFQVFPCVSHTTAQSK